MDFEIVKQGDNYRTVIATIATATVIEAGDMCELSSGLPIKGTATGAKLAYSPFACPSGDVQIELTVGTDFLLKGTGEAVFAVDQKGDECDLVVAAGVQLVDNDTTSTSVFTIDFSENAGTVGSTADIYFSILKPLY
jgi:hypothetical protein